MLNYNVDSYERMLGNINEKAIDYTKVDELLKAHRKVAKEYLRKNLS